MNRDQLIELATICTRDDAGRHFSDVCHHWQSLEDLGMIEVTRPIHDATGIPYDYTYWTVNVTDAGREALEGFEMPNEYTVDTDAFHWSGYADSLDDAIACAFGDGITNEASLRESFDRDAANCVIRENGIKVIDI